MKKSPLADALLDWFRSHQRPLPWRKHYEPYQVWISEIMLQQTQVSTALPYFRRFIRELPTVQDLANVPEDRLLKLWEGLGYYSRALNLKRAAQKLVRENNGVLFDRYEDLLRLPGIGRYTAGAIMSIAYEKDYPVVDGNVVRVLARLSNNKKNVKEVGDLFWNQAQKLLPTGEARDFNQALMEFGALQCTPKSPACGTCPLQKFCKAYAHGTQNELPNKGASRSKTPISVVVGVIHKKGKVFIQKRRNSGLMAGLWEFPGGKIEVQERPTAALHREIKEELGLTVADVRSFMKLKHTYTSYQVDLQCFLAEYNSGRIRLNAATEGRWVAIKDLKKFAFPAANGKIIDRLIDFSDF